MAEAQQIAILNEDGTVKSKEDFMKDIEKVYDELKGSLEKEQAQQSTFEVFADPDNQIDPEVVLQTYDFIDRSIYLTDEIEMAHANSIFEVVKFWNNIDDMDNISVEERKPICLYINTPGGDLDATFSIISTIKLSKTPVHTYTIGTAYSGGFFIAISGHKRFGFPYSSYLFHEGSAMDGGDAHKFIQRVNFYKKQLKRLRQVVLDNTKITSEEYDEAKADDWFMNPKEALKYGVIDKIVDKLYEGDEEE